MTKRWSSTASGDGKTKRRASKDARQDQHKQADDELCRWLEDQGAVESVTFDEETGRPMRTFTIDLKK